MESAKVLKEEEEEEDSDLLYAMQLASSIVLPMVLQSAMELGVFQIIAAKAGPGGFMSSDEIASHLPTNNNPDASLMLDRILSLLATYSILNCSSTPQTLYSLAPVSKYFTVNEDSDGVSLSSYFALNKLFMESW